MITQTLPPTDLECFEAVMKCLHTLDYYAPPVPWGEDSDTGLPLIPPDHRGQYVFASERDFATAFGNVPLPEDALHPTYGVTMRQPIALHWSGEGTLIARAFHEAGFFVRWRGTSGSTIQIGIRAFENPQCPIWTPDPWSHLMSVLRVLETHGYAAPQTPTITMEAEALPSTRITFGVLEHNIARLGALQSGTPTTTLKTPLFLTWHGTPEAGIHIAETFHQEGCQVWWRGEPHALIGVAPRPCNLTVLSPHFPPWQPPGA